MNTLKTAPLLALSLVFLMSAPAYAQSNTSASAGIHVDIEVGGSSTKSRKKHKKRSRHDARHDHRRDKKRAKKRRGHARHRSGHQHNSTTVVHEHVVVHEYAEPAPQEPQYYPMHDAQFAQMIAQIQAEPFSSGKMSVLTIAAEYNYFSSAQTRAVVSSLTFSSDKVEAAVLLYPKILDPGAFYQVLSAFTFESSKEEVRTRLAL